MPLILDDITSESVSKMSDEDFASVLFQTIELQQSDRKENQLLYYKPVSEHAEKIHLSHAKIVGVGGGNRASKTDTILAHLSMCATGIIPYSLKDKIDIEFHFRGPVSVRIVVESLTTTLHTILDKLKWWKWGGVDREGGERGHYGWIPKTCLIDGDWEKSWSEKLRTLTVLCRDPYNPDRVLGESTFQFMSHDQDPPDFASGQFHHILEDEYPRHAIWIENQARTMSVDGRHYIAMTWPDDPTIPVDYIFDEIYEKGQPGPGKNQDIDWFELYSTDNPYINQETVAAQSALWSDEIRKVRIYGQPIRFSNRIHPGFTDRNQVWCFKCGKDIIPEVDKCSVCGSKEITPYCHVQEFLPRDWPTIFVLDPHPRRPHMFLWGQVDPSDDIWVVAEGSVEGDCVDAAEFIFKTEEEMGLNIAMRLIDPNMGRSPASSHRDITWQDEFDRARLYCDLADDSSVGRSRINQFLKPDPHTYHPRLVFSHNVPLTIHQMKRYVWDNFKRNLEKELKQKPKEKYSDLPTCLKYLFNTEPTFSFLKQGAPVIRTRRKTA